MQFNSYEFLIFLPIVILLNFLIPKKYRYIWLLLSSYYFYMCWNPKYALLMLFSTVVTYLSGLLIGKYQDNLKTKKIILASSFTINLSILFLFKYLDFVINNLNDLTENFGLTLSVPTFDLLLPVGISFYTFQALSYSVDVYKNNIKPEKNILRYALFVSFFPQLVAGPIEKSRDLLPQLEKANDFNFDRAKSGVMLMCWGFVQKLVIADRMAVIVNIVYNNYQDYTGIYLLIATLCFGIQIYCDFSSYSDIAIGTSRILGIKLSDNFKRPYFSKSISEFWKRWHITLGAWFREYLYIPLGGNRKGKLIKYRNIMIVFIVSGLWHGASWGFVIWGLLHGLYQVIGDILLPIRTKILNVLHINKKSFFYKLLQVSIVYLLVNFAWIFFRASSATIALEIITKIFTINIIELFTNPSLNIGLMNYEVIILLLSVILLICVSLFRRKYSINKLISNQCVVVRYLAYTVIATVLVFFWVSGQATGDSTFIYFQF